VKHFAKALQAVGLILLPVGLAVGMVQGDTRTELVLLAVGGTVFVFGKYALEPRGD
jgi:hypothetical protein